MFLQVNFVVSAPSLYEEVLRSIIDPIRIYLPESIISKSGMNDAVNIHFFNEKSYREEMVEPYAGTHVFMSHGIGDKQWRDGPAVQYFDYICTSGPLWLKKMINQGIPSEKLLMTGFPKLDPLFQETKKIKKNFQKTVLYAPTHGNAAPCTSYPSFLEYIDRFPEDFKVLNRPHPYNKEVKNPVLQEFMDADVVISDGSSIIYEALALGIPVVFPDWLVKNAILERWPHSFTAQMYRDDIGYHAESFEHLIHLIYRASEEGLKEKDQSFISEIFPVELRGHSGETSADAFKRLSML